MKPTRYYSDRQEKQIVKEIGGKQVAGSGSSSFHKGDTKTKLFLIEAKTTTKHKDSFAIKLAWLKKNKEEAFAMNRPYNALAFNFGPDEENYYIIDQKLFKQLIDFIEQN